MRLFLALTVGLLLAGCTLTPDYERPVLDVPDDYNEPAEDGASVVNIAWWDLFQDVQLQRLIETALEENKDLGVALQRIYEARAQLTFTRANQFPFLNVFGLAERRDPSDVLVPGSSARNNYALSADLSFEVDLWGKLGRATEAARADLLATDAAYRNVTISLVSSVASTYFLLRDLDARLVISENTVKSRRDSLGIIQARFDKGTVPELDVNQAQIELAIAEAAVASFQRQIVQTENALRILLGRNPGPVARGASLDQQALPSILPTGLPSDLLQRRPDLVTAEEQLKAATARVGVAEALRYPSINLFGTLGLESDDRSDFTSSDAKTWSIGTNLFAPIFNSGQLKAQAEAQRAITEQAMLNYESTLQQALREVEDALVAIRTYNTEHAARTRQAVAARNAARLSRARYDGGVVDYLEVLDSERSLFNAELEQSVTLRFYLNSIVELYKALGGGWDPGSV
ncbi:MAG: efflux transporter outer membrane subunit [Gammaproteobacteria bacterium]|jgi:multidrug efflux system outer membrane protein|nr:efflux transporter outer membrane subunit [Gammaproteobacteria bacterium]